MTQTSRIFEFWVNFSVKFLCCSKIFRYNNNIQNINVSQQGVERENNVDGFNISIKSGGSLVEGSVVRGSVVRGSLVRGSLVLRFTCSLLIVD